jgi:hypothetical protein
MSNAKSSLSLSSHASLWASRGEATLASGGVVENTAEVKLAWSA